MLLKLIGVPHIFFRQKIRSTTAVEVVLLNTVITEMNTPEREREGGREGGRGTEGGREGGKEREGQREGGREGERESVSEREREKPKAKGGELHVVFSNR